MTPVVISYFHVKVPIYKPKECQSIRASSGTCSRFLLSSSSADSRVIGFMSCAIQSRTRLFSSVMPMSVFA
jgi:hypothetical protein